MKRPSGFVILIAGILSVGLSFAAGMGVDHEIRAARCAAEKRKLAETTLGARTEPALPTRPIAIATQTPRTTVRTLPRTPSSERVRPFPIGKTEGRVLAEFEHLDGLLLGVNELIQFHPDTLVAIVRAIHEKIKIIGIVANADQEAKTLALLKENGLPATTIDFFRWPVEAMWVRDYAPYFVVGEESTVVDFTYAEKNRDMEEQVGLAIAATFGFSYDHCRLTFEGGNLCTNGKGLCVSTTRMVDRNLERGYTVEQIGGLLHDHFHFDRWIRLLPLSEEPTGHADMFFVMIGPHKCLLGAIDSADDPENAKILDQNATILSGEKTDDGPMEVVRIPVPSHKDGVWRTYTNVIFANGTLLVPQYPDLDPKMDKTALELYRSLLPDWKVVGIDCTKLIVKRGALHCISRHIPRLPAPPSD